MPTRARIALAVAWPVALIAWLYQRTAGIGFNIMDDGLIAAYARRLLDGQVPHRDVISPRPLGSAVLHIPDLLIPLPFYRAERLVGITEVVVFSILAAWLIFRCAPWKWGPGRAALAATAALVNLHTFIETPWYTLDGLILVCAAILLVRAGLEQDRRLVAAGLILAGLAVTTKQSFAPAPVLILAWLALADRGRMPDRVKRLATGAALAALPMLVYMAWVTVAGGLDDTVSQLTSGRLVWGRPLLAFIGIDGPKPDDSGHFFLWIGLSALALAYARRRAAPPLLMLAIAAAMSIVTLRLVFSQHLSYLGAWSIELMWALFLVVVVRVAVERRVDWAGTAILFMGWMAMLSWGYQVPALVAGSAALAIVWWAFEGAQPAVAAVRRRRLAGAAAAVAALGVFAFTAAKLVDARDDQPYFDRPAPQLTASIGDISSEFRGIRTTPVMASYLRGLVACLEHYPARRVAVLPDNPGLYVALDLHNPLPIDWLFAQDYTGQGAKILGAARRLQAEGDYLVLLQTVSGLALAGQKSLPDATRSSSPVLLDAGPYNPDVGRALIETLKGRHIVCGSFLGIWSPHAA